MSKLAAALALAAEGYRVFPLAINGKTPAIDGNWRKIATTDPQRIESMWRCPVLDTELDYNIGIALNRNTLVLDEDVSDGKQGDRSREVLEAIHDPLPATFTVRSARGGRHVYLKTNTPVGNSASKVGKHLDIKTDGGFTVGPGSEIDGVPYVVEHNAPIALAPEWLTSLAGAPRDRTTSDASTPAADLDTPQAIARAIEYLATRAPDAGTYSVAARVKDFGISRETCHELIMEHWPPASAKGDEHVQFRVDNAYRYGQNAPGNRSPEAEFEPVEIDSDKSPPKRKGLYVTTWRDTKVEADRPYLIDGVLETGSMIVTYGDSNTGKSFVALDQAYHIAAGKEWNGRKVKQGMVVYVASEGGPGFAKRIEAIKRRTGALELPFYLVPCPVDLFSDTGSTAALVKLIKACEAESGQKCALVVIDTLARAMGGGDENTSTDMGKFVVNCDRVRAATGAAMNIVHHTGKDKARGARGSSALRAATDTEIEIAPGIMAMTKQRDGGMPSEMRFRLAVVEIGKREDGAAVTSCVVEWLSVDEFSDEVSPAAQEMLDVLERLVAARRDEIAEDESLSEAEREAAGDWVPWKIWEAECLERIKGPRGKPLKRTGLYPLRQELSDTDKINKNRQNEWRAK